MRKDKQAEEYHRGQLEIQHRAMVRMLERVDKHFDRLCGLLEKSLGASATPTALCEAPLRSGPSDAATRPSPIASADRLPWVQQLVDTLACCDPVPWMDMREALDAAAAHGYLPRSKDGGLAGSIGHVGPPSSCLSNEKQPWKPKVGDLVVPISVPTDVGESFKPGMKAEIGKVHEVMCPDVNLCTLRDGNPGWWKWDLRPATPEEAAEYRKRKEWEKVDGLQEGDAYEGQDFLHVYRELVAMGVRVTPVGCNMDEAGGFSFHHYADANSDGIAFYGGLSLRADCVNILPKDELLRRAKLTAAKMRKEEESKPLAHGTKVRLFSTGEMGFIMSYRVDGSCKVSVPGGEVLCDRSNIHVVRDNN